MQDANIARKIVAALGITPEDFILEIGPGSGALTGIIRAHGPARLVLVEKDGHWARERMRQGGADVILADAMTLAWERFSSPWKIIGNLPYNVASPLMWEIFSRASGLSRAVFMVQKEVGLRLVARPGTSAYSALSVWVQTFVQPKTEFIVPPRVFHPRPKVDSAVLSFVPRPGGGLHRAARQQEKAGSEIFASRALAATVKKCFQMRRKQMGTILRSLGKPAAVLADLQIDPQSRPENLSPEDYHRLAATGFFLQSWGSTD